jgi:RNA polymerase sigma-70 factor, ECF subfamily
VDVSEQAAPDAGQVFQEHRSRLLGVAYRVLGSVADAEDVLQETWLRWSTADHSAVRDPRAHLTTMTSRLALNSLRARRSRREDYVGPWLPDPILTPGTGSLLGDQDPADPVLLAESVSMAFLVVLESLSPLERVVFVLHDLFGYAHAEVARTVERSEPAVRQLASRARRHVRERRPSTTGAPTDPAEHARVTETFMRAAVTGEVAGLLAVLAPDVVVLTDGGGAAKAARRPVRGADNAARFLAGISQGVPGVTWEVTSLNGRAGVLVHLAGQLLGTVDLDTADGRVVTLRVQLNPAKLTGVRSARGKGVRDI